MCEILKDGCEILDAEAIYSNEQLLSFDLRSANIEWREHITTLQHRSAPIYLQRQHGLVSSYREPIGDHNRRQVLLCHDLMGNYLEDRFYNGSKKYDYYRFYHWAAIDYFCYFSHNYITIPPSGWINAAHKHGVLVVGTFIAEGDKGSSLLHEVLQSREKVEEVVNGLVNLCCHFRFEGWLVNVECKVESTALENLYYFVDHLRDSIQKNVLSGIVFWYDSIIDTGELKWQNEINDKNLRFCKAADGMLLNYTWNAKHLNKTSEICALNSDDIKPHRTFFGIDIFGRGQLAKFQSKSTLAHIVKHRFSTGFFAPGWTFETLQQYGYDIKQPLGSDEVNEAFMQRNEKFWGSVWEFLATHPYRNLPFETDFCLGSGKRRYRFGVVSDQDPFFNLTLQSLQPSVPLFESAERYYKDAFNGGCCLRILKDDHIFRLFVSDFRFQRGGLVFGYAYKMDKEDSGGDFDCILRICAANNARDCYLYLGDYNGSISVQRGCCKISPFNCKYYDMLSQSMQISSIMPPNLQGGNFRGWRVRYYVAAFDGLVQVKDIGVLYRRNNNYAAGSAYLGAVFINEFDANEFHFPVDSNIALLQIYGNDLLN